MNLVKVDIYIFSLIIQFFVISYIQFNSAKKSTATKLYISIVMSTSFMLVLEAATWLVDGVVGPYLIGINYTLNFLLFLTSVIPILLWLIYFDFRIFGNFKVIKRRIRIYAVPIFIIAMLLFNNHKTGFVYTISDMNVYERGAGMYIIVLISYIILMSYIINMRLYRDRLEVRLLKVFFYFAGLPTASAALQSIAYGTTLIWPSMSLVSLVAFVFIEREELLRDALTGLMTRGQLEQRLRHKLKHKRPFTLVMMDVDKFKQINDTHGHDEGDQALIVIARYLNKSVKQVDMVCRFAGDEFMILIEDTGEQTGEVVVDRIEEELKDYNNRKVKNYQLEMSFGHIYIQKPQRYSMLKLLGEVDERMYKNKRSKH